MCRALAPGLAVALALAGTGCGGAGTKSEGDVANVAAGGETKADGRLRAPAKPLRLADLRREQRGPQAAILRLFYFAQWGSAPNIASAYDPAVRRVVGVSNIVGTYSGQRASLAKSRLRIIESTKTPTGTFVSVELLRADAPPERHSFSLRQRFGQWRIVYDTLLEGGLANYVASMRSRNPVDKLPDRRAVIQGQTTAQRYRGLFASTIDR
jgi:hypothetical protein